MAEYLEATPASDATHEALSVHFQALDAYTNSVLVDETDQDFGEIFCKLSLGRVYCKIIASKEFEYLAS